jgi:hypothetical protein
MIGFDGKERAYMYCTRVTCILCYITCTRWLGEANLPYHQVVTYQCTYLNASGVTYHNVVDMTIVRGGRCRPKMSKGKPEIVYNGVKGGGATLFLKAAASS